MSINEPKTDPYWKPDFYKRRGEYFASIMLTPTDGRTWWNTSSTKLILGDLVIYFHYQYVLGFYTPNGGLIISENWDRSSSVGRVLNGINEDKSIREPHDVVLNKLTEYLREDFFY